MNNATAAEIQAEEDAETANQMPEGADPDAKRVSDLVGELNEILERRDWPGVCLVLAKMNEEQSCACGFAHLSMPGHMMTLVSARDAGLKLLKAAKIIAED